ncbi:MAG: hypothetical protein MUE85_02605 [Microscillaceae bacterium]|jgi:hypothetical protein|nr:hypothetical protein [Microscillaceae bacterium]
MKRRLFIILTLIINGLIASLLSSCEEYVQLNLVFTGKVGNPTDKTVQVEGVVSDLKSPLLEHGHCWSTSPQPTVNDFKTELGPRSEAGTFVSLLTDLNPNTLYFIRAYLISETEVRYGEQLSVQTLPLQVGIKEFQASTEGLSDIKASSATAKGKLLTEVSINLAQYGHIWATQATPTLSNNSGSTNLGALPNLSNNRDYSGAMTVLNPNTLYYYRAYAVDNTNKVYYGTIRQFTTPN